ncbi:MAG: hypoxanthine phosphoribosyltransferase [Clostridia bacterium]|nr:hypoxanthine phosphoribosyltransferase [Clostridia bacterium]
MNQMNKDIEKILFTEEEIQKRVKELGEQISRDYKDERILLVGTLKGSVIFLADLMREISSPCELDFMVVSSYGSGSRTSGNVKIIKDLESDIAGVNVLIVEDIIDSGVTLSTLREMLMERKPKSLRICTMFNKPARREKDVQYEYCGFDVPDMFVVGYGLDYAQLYRNLPYLGELKKSVYEK